MESTKLAYQWLKTDDGSWTLCQTRENGVSESMHHRGGALTESRFIYQTAMDEVFSKVSQPRVISVGLGLGYNELLLAESELKARSEALKQGSYFEMAHLVSFEKDPLLTEQFLQGLEQGVKQGIEPEPPQRPGQTTEPPIEPPIEPPSSHSQEKLYQELLGYFSPEVAKLLLQKRARESWQVRGALDEESYLDLPAQDLILWDAFSPKMTQELWQPDFLTQFCKRLSKPGTVFVTYACNRNLKDSLIQAGYRVDRRKGFSNKKHCTHAVFIGRSADL